MIRALQTIAAGLKQKASGILTRDLQQNLRNADQTARVIWNDIWNKMEDELEYTTVIAIIKVNI